MIRNIDIQNEYVDLYKLFRDYIWDYSVVCKLADLEVRCYETCPNIPGIQESLWKLKSSILNTLQDDDEMVEVFDEFEKLLEDSNNEYYVDLPIVKETIQEKDHEDNFEDDFEDDFEEESFDDKDFEDFDEDLEDESDMEDIEDENFEENE